MPTKKTEKAQIMEYGTREDSELLKILKSTNPATIKVDSSQAKDKTQMNELAPRYDYTILAKLYEMNTYHARCIDVKAALTCLLGYNLTTDDENKTPDDEYKAIKTFIDSQAEITGIDFLQICYRYMIDRLLFGNGHLEVVRNVKGEVAALYHVPAINTWLYRPADEELKVGVTYLRERIGGDETLFRPFGLDAKTDKNKELHEFIHGKKYSPFSKYYGVPEYIANIGVMVLDRSAVEFNARNFENNLMIASIIEILGIDVSGEDGKSNAVDDFFKNNFQGVSKAGKSLVIKGKDTDPERARINVHKLADGVKDASFRMLRADNKEETVAAHGVPPRLVGMMTAGQLGGDSEAKQQMTMFRDIVVKPLQVELQNILNQKIIKGAFPENKKWKIEFNTLDINDAVEDANYYQSIMSFTDEAGRKVYDIDEIRQAQNLPPRKHDNKPNANDKANDKNKDDKTALVKSVDNGMDLLLKLSKLRKSIKEELEKQ